MIPFLDKSAHYTLVAFKLLLAKPTALHTHAYVCSAVPCTSQIYVPCGIIYIQ